MQETSKIAVRKKAVECLRQVIRDLTTAGDHGTAAQITPILNRLSERRKLDGKPT